VRATGARVNRLALGALLLSGCAPTQAEVGSDPPVDAGAIVGDGTSNPADALDTGGGARCDALAPLQLYEWNLRTTATSTDINYIVKVENGTGTAIAMSSLEVRYYFTNELTPSATIDVFYTDTCCSNKKTDFNDGILTRVSALPARPSADAYLSIAFAPTVGSLADGDAVQVEIGFHDVGYARTLTQTNDYSYAATAGGTQAQWDDCPGPQCESKFTSCTLTVYQDGLLVWGSPP
jgi:hypothetical protein